MKHYEIDRNQREFVAVARWEKQMGNDFSQSVGADRALAELKHTTIAEVAVQLSR
jgi:hypothetical protein